jgi:enolase
LEEEDYKGFADITRELDVQILGDDIFVTNPNRFMKGIEVGAANALLWKVNQVGTLTEALKAAKLAESNGYAVQASHRSGDTEDTFVADLAVGISCGQIKSGATARGERTAKYNRLLRIEEMLGERAIFPQSLSP